VLDHLSKLVIPIDHELDTRPSLQIVYQ